MPLLDRSRVEIKLGDYGVAPATAISDTTILPRVQEYRRLVGSRMIPLAKDDIASKIPTAEFHMSRKVDGEFTVLVVDGEDAFTINPGGTVRVNIPFLAEAQALLKKGAVKTRIMLAGELYVQRPDGKRPRIHDVVKNARQPLSKDDVAALRFSVFDILETQGTPYAETWKRIGQLFGAGKSIHPVETIVVKTPAEVEDKFEKWVEKDGGEGLVLRSDTAGMFKVKTKHTVDCVVVGFTESVEPDRKGMMHDLLVALMRSDGTFHLVARVGGGYTDELRREFLSDLKDMAVESDYTEVNPDHLAYQMVRPEWVIEVSCVDVISQTTRGGSIDKMVLTWNKATKKWEGVRKLPIAALISPNYVRKRDDKHVRVEDLRLAQITDIVEVPLVDRDASRMALPKSEVLRREAYTKVIKGQTMVRKLIMWKTNKDRESPEDFPAFVVHLTDFSPNRKTPLEREIRVSSNQSQIDQLWSDLKTEYIVKGWNPA
jgi:hypothetical protein